MKRSVVLIILLLYSPVVVATPPSWLENSTRLQGHMLQVGCEGTGADLSTARQDALSNCVSSASDYLANEHEITKLSVETDSEVGFHKSVGSNTTIRNLICDQKKEQIQTSDESTKVYLLCSYNLSKVVANSPKTPPVNYDSEAKLYSLSEREVVPGSFKEGRYLASDARSVSLATVPNCSSIIVKGKRSRSYLCKSNPVQIILEPTDQEIIVRAKNHVPKIIQAKDLLGGHTNEDFQVILNPN